MKLENFIHGWSERNAEEKRRRQADAKKRKKRLSMVITGILAAILMICCIGCSAGTPTDSSSQVKSQLSSSTAEQTPETEESQPPETAEPTETPTPEETQKPTETAKPTESETPTPQVTAPVIDLSSIPAFSGVPYVAINDNVPEFTDADLTTTSFETYSNLDSLGRCGVAYACIGIDLMPTEERGSIGQVKPSGWHTVKYDIVDGKYLYNRCHLIGYQLTAENANTKNLITGTRYLNVEGMLPFENMVADYIKETGNHVLYRVTPAFEGDNLLASGVQMEAMSVEDKGESILFNVYCYNAQPGVSIDYTNGDSELDGSAETETHQETETITKLEETTSPASSGTTYILNTNTHKFHYPDCSSVKKMSEKNKQEFTGTRDEVINMGYDPCGNCNP